MARLGKNQTLAMYAEAKRLLHRCLSRAERVGGFSKDLEARVVRAQLDSLRVLIARSITTQGCRRAVILILEYAVKDNEDDPELCRQLVDLHNRLYPEMEWTGKW